MNRKTQTNKRDPEFSHGVLYDTTLETAILN